MFPHHPNRTKRLRRYYLQPELALAYLQSMAHWPQAFGRCIVTDIPDDARIERLFWSEERRCFVVLVSHPSFDEIPDGLEVPEGMGGYANLEKVWIARDADGAYRCGDKMEVLTPATFTPEQRAAIMTDWVRQRRKMMEIPRVLEVPAAESLEAHTTDQLIKLREQINTILYDRSA